jgi:hypothetical protein
MNIRRELQQQGEVVNQQREEMRQMLAQMQQQQVQMQQQQQLQLQQHQQLQMRMMPPFMLPLPPYMGGFPPPVLQHHDPDGLSAGMPHRYVESLPHPPPPIWPTYDATEAAPTSNGFVPAANHVQQAGMSGAPELAPEQLGKIPEFQAHVRNYNAYAMKAVSRHEPHLSLAQTMRKHAFAIATTFTTQVLKRYRVAPHSFRQGDTLHYTAESVMALPDDVFTRLYTESCSISIEDPSQVHTILSQLEYVRQTQDEDGPLPALMRAEATFRSKLSLLPQHAVERCRPQELRDAFIKMFFTTAKFDTMKMDFQNCATWEQVYQQLAYRAGSSTLWYSDVPRHKATPDVSVTPTVSSSSPAQPVKTKQAAEDSAAYWKRELQKLQKSMKYDASILEDAVTDKRKVKILQKLKYRQALESEIREQVATAYRQHHQQHAREQSRERQLNHFRSSRDSSREPSHDQQRGRTHSHESTLHHQNQRSPGFQRDTPSFQRQYQQNNDRLSSSKQDSGRTSFQRPVTPPAEDRQRPQHQPDRPSSTASPRSNQHTAGTRSSASPRPRSGSPSHTS